MAAMEQKIAVAVDDGTRGRVARVFRAVRELTDSLEALTTQPVGFELADPDAPIVTVTPARPEP